MSTLRVKICGLTSPEQALATSLAGADAIGLVFYPKSTRYVADLNVARDICLAAGPFVSTVGLFVDADSQTIERVLERVPLSMLQFHGAENEAFCHSFRRPYIKALRMKPGLDVVLAAQPFGSAHGILLDAYTPGTPGGTGEVFDWLRVPNNLEKPLILAGGLDPSNVAAAIMQTHPWAVDVSGGVEISPGQKSPELVREFIMQAKSAKFCK